MSVAGSKELARFTAQGEDGRTYSVIVEADVIRTAQYRESGSTALGMKKFRVLDGGYAYLVRPGVLEVVGTGVRIRSEHPFVTASLMP